MINAVIFDLDDTLISEREYIKSGYKVVSKKIKEEYKLNFSADEVYECMYGLFENDPKNVFNRLLDYYHLYYDEKYISDLVATYREHIPSIKFFKDVIPCLEILKLKGIKLGIITDGYSVTQKNKLNVLNAYEIFDKIVVTDELGKEYWKPNPRAFEIIRDFFDLQYQDMIYIADNPKKDFYIKKYYPVNTIKICREDSLYRDSEYLENIKEDYITNDLHMLSEIIEKINKKYV